MNENTNIKDLEAKLVELSFVKDELKKKYEELDNSFGKGRRASRSGKSDPGKLLECVPSGLL